MQCTSRGRSTLRWVFAIVSILSLLVGIPGFGAGSSAIDADAGDWPTYQFSLSRSGFNGADTTINPSSASHLKLHWMDNDGWRDLGTDSSSQQRDLLGFLE